MAVKKETAAEGTDNRLKSKTVRQMSEQKTMQQEKTKGTLQKSLYSLEELSAHAQDLFKTKQECVEAALKASGKKEAGLEEAKELVMEFLTKEVQ